MHTRADPRYAAGMHRKAEPAGRHREAHVLALQPVANGICTMVPGALPTANAQCQAETGKLNNMAALQLLLATWRRLVGPCPCPPSQLLPRPPRTPCRRHTLRTYGPCRPPIYACVGAYSCLVLATLTPLPPHARPPARPAHAGLVPPRPLRPPPGPPVPRRPRGAPKQQHHHHQHHGDGGGGKDLQQRQRERRGGRRQGMHCKVR